MINASDAAGSFDYTVTADTGATTTGHVDFTSVVTTDRANTVTALATLAAADIQGRGGNDRLTGSNGDDRLLGNGGDDRLVGLAGDDRLNGGLGSDVMIGGRGDDSYVVDRSTDSITELAGEGTDTVLSSVSWTLSATTENLDLIGLNAINGTGNAQANEISGNAAANVLDGRAGADLMRGGFGNDTYVVDNAGDQVVEIAAGGVDTVRTTLTSYTLGDNVEDLDFVGFGNATLNGNDLANEINGGAGADLLAGGAGRDILNGGSGRDILIGGAGDDLVNGGMGADVFVFESLGDFDPTTLVLETIGDFRRGQGDRIDLSAIDANSTIDGDQAFAFIGTAAFGQNAGELRYAVTKSGATLSGDVDGDGLADFAIRLNGVSSLGSVDFAV